jgi:predicted phosphodiesterase
MRLALIADVHGNVWALEAVLQDIERRGVREIANLGDNAYGPLEPGAAVDLLMGAKIPGVRGNQDRVLKEAAGETVPPTLAYTRSRLSERQTNWLCDEPATLEKGGVFCCHGTLLDDTEYLLEAVDVGGVSLRSADEIGARVAGIDATLIACGHSHVPRVVMLGNGTVVVNPGSVGLPAYADDAPVQHRMETGSPHARYAVARRQGDQWLVDLIAVPYDCAAAAACARRQGREDWAHAIESGYAR